MGGFYNVPQFYLAHPFGAPHQDPPADNDRSRLWRMCSTAIASEVVVPKFIVERPE